MKTTSPQPRHVTARFFDGRSAKAHPVNIWFMPDCELVVQGHGFELRHQATELKLDSALGATPRFLHLPGGQCCEFADLARLDEALTDWPASTGFKRRASGWRFMLCALLGLLVAVWLVISQGVPLAARLATVALPTTMVEKIGAGSLADLDATAFAPSRLPIARQQEVLSKARAFLASVGESPDRRIIFRSAPGIGANAMALPSGVIVFTDDIIHLATNDDQLLAVLAHECGHVHYRHGLRGILQQSAVSMAITMAVGKQSAASAMQSQLTAQLINSRYSREFEFEADGYGARLLAQAAIPSSRLGEMLDLLEKQSAHAQYAHGRLDSYLQSHPSTPERKNRLERH
jgi:Zn-dependent protease with chaperone function